MPNTQGPFSRGKHIHSHCKRCGCFEFLDDGLRKDSYYDGTEICLGCPHRANQHVRNDIEEKILHSPERNPSSPIFGYSHDPNLDQDSSPVQRLSSRKPTRTPRDLTSSIKGSVGFLSSDVQASLAPSSEKVPKQLSTRLGKIASGDYSSLPPPDSKPVLFPPSSEPVLPPPVEGKITLDKLYHYLIARSDRTDRLHTRLLKSYQDHNRETAALLNSLYIDFASFHKEIKDVKRKVDEIAGNYLDERPTKRTKEGSYTAPKTTVKAIFPESRLWEYFLDNNDSYRLNTPEGDAPSSRKMSASLREEFSRPWKRGTPIAKLPSPSGSRSIGNRSSVVVGTKQKSITKYKPIISETEVKVPGGSGRKLRSWNSSGKETSVEESGQQEAEQGEDSRGKIIGNDEKEQKDEYEDDSDESQDDQEDEDRDEGQDQDGEEEKEDTEGDEEEEAEGEVEDEEGDEGEGGGEVEEEEEKEEEAYKDEGVEGSFLDVADYEGELEIYLNRYGDQPILQLFSGTLPLLTPITEEERRRSLEESTPASSSLLSTSTLFPNGENSSFRIADSPVLPLIDGEQKVGSGREKGGVLGDAGDEDIEDIKSQYHSSPPLASPNSLSKSSSFSSLSSEVAHDTTSKKRKRQLDTSGVQNSQKRSHTEEHRGTKCKEKPPTGSPIENSPSELCVARKDFSEGGSDYETSNNDASGENSLRTIKEWPSQGKLPVRDQSKSRTKDGTTPSSSKRDVSFSCDSSREKTKRNIPPGHMNTNIVTNMEESPKPLLYVDTRARRSRGETAQVDIDIEEPQLPTVGRRRQPKRKSTGEMNTEKAQII